MIFMVGRGESEFYRRLREHEQQESRRRQQEAKIKQMVDEKILQHEMDAVSKRIRALNEEIQKMIKPKKKEQKTRIPLQRQPSIESDRAELRAAENVLSKLLNAQNKAQPNTKEKFQRKIGIMQQRIRLIAQEITRLSNERTI